MKVEMWSYIAKIQVVQARRLVMHVWEIGHLGRKESYVIEFSSIGTKV